MPEGRLDRYPGYDVLRKRDTPSWNDVTRRVIDARLAISDRPRFLSETDWATLQAICERVVPQPPDRPAIPVAALVDDKLCRDDGDGYRNAKLPRLREAWQRGLRAIDAEARVAHGTGFVALDGDAQDALLRAAKQGDLRHPAWEGMPSDVFFDARLLRDIVHAYYSHPTAWSEIGFGGPASPRGYVRMDFDRRDRWEAVEAKGGDEAEVRRRNQRVG
ncbi:MAG: gluconate 2-dehydrogenase subunit 3 family protein [Rhodospirillales bacterium]|nr:gluconate 2-dehydrogenase subunit 3 family protein [Rhodospirillales bacterium]